MDRSDEGPRGNVEAELSGLAGCTVAICGGAECHHATDQAIGIVGPAISASSGGVLVRTECLRACAHGPVTIVHRRPAPGEPGCVVALNAAGEERLEAVAGWVGAGGPGVAPMPETVSRCVIYAR